MKKIFSLILFAAFVFAGCSFNQANAQPHHGKKMGQIFEKRLNLSEKQKEKAKNIHKKGHEQMKPVMEQIGQKHKELAAVKKDETLSQEQKQEKIKELSAQMKELNKQAMSIRKQNSKDFEKILTRKQKKELEKMKAEGRAKFEKHHPPRKPFDFFSAPGFWNQKPLFPSVQPPEPKELK